MSKLILAFSLILIISSSAFADILRFSWEPNTEEALAGYKIHCGVSTGVYTEIYDVFSPDLVAGRVQSEIDIARGNWYCAATAYDTYGDQSDYSNEAISRTVGKPTDFKKEKR